MYFEVKLCPTCAHTVASCACVASSFRGVEFRAGDRVKLREVGYLGTVAEVVGLARVLVHWDATGLTADHYAKASCSDLDNLGAAPAVAAAFLQDLHRITSAPGPLENCPFSLTAPKAKPARRAPETLPLFGD